MNFKSRTKKRIRKRTNATEREQKERMERKEAKGRIRKKEGESDSSQTNKVFAFFNYRIRSFFKKYNAKLTL